MTAMVLRHISKAHENLILLKLSGTDAGVRFRGRAGMVLLRFDHPTQCLPKPASYGATRQSRRVFLQSLAALLKRWSAHQRSMAAICIDGDHPVSGDRCVSDSRQRASMRNSEVEVTGGGPKNRCSGEFESALAKYL